MANNAADEVHYEEPIGNGGYEFRLELFRLRLGAGAPQLALRAPWPAALAFGSCAAYALLVRGALSTTWWRGFARRHAAAHYAALCAYSAACCLAAAYELGASGEAAEFAAWLLARAGGGGAGPPRAPPALYCRPVPKWLRLVSLSFIVSKAWEWADTLVLIAQGKSLEDIGVLHLYHHATTVGLFFVVTSFPVTEKSGLLLNGFVHALMYFHFAFRLPRFMRPLLTGAQIAQLAAVTLAWIDCAQTCDEAIAFKRDHRLEFLLPFAAVPVYLLLFVRFFVEQYVLKTTKGRERVDGGEAAAAAAAKAKAH